MNTRKNTTGVIWGRVVLTIIALLAISATNILAQRDRGRNQPGAAGNRGGADPGLNQPGAAGNVGGSARQTRAVGDPGLNQPGAAGNGNRAGDPGVNQPGATGNRR